MAEIQEIIARVNDVQFNEYPDRLKVQWIAQLDGQIATDVYLMPTQEAARYAYRYPQDMKATPLVDFPYDCIYDYWLLAQMQFHGEEYEKYQNTMEMFNKQYAKFCSWFLTYYAPEKTLGKNDNNVGGGQFYYITAYGLAVKLGYKGTLEQWLSELAVSVAVEEIDGGHRVTLTDSLGEHSFDVMDGNEYEQHRQNRENPHAVTKEQVGLGNVDNTSDENKPVSIAQRQALEAIDKKIPNVDEALSVEGAAADAKAVGQELERLEGKFNRQLLWQNTSPIAIFASKVINVAQAVDYKTLIIVFRHSTNYGHLQETQIISGRLAHVYFPASKVNGNNYDETYRVVTREGEAVRFESGYRNGSADDSAAIPAYIYGIDHY